MTARDIDIMLQRQQAMQRAKLQQNDHKGGWRGDDLAALLFRLYEEADELKAEVLRLMELHRQGAKALQPKQTLAVMHEAADVANFAGFVIDKLWCSKPDPLDDVDLADGMVPAKEGAEIPLPPSDLTSMTFDGGVYDVMPQSVKDAIAESVRTGEPLRILNADGSIHTIEPMRFDHQPAPGNGDNDQ